GDRQQAIEVWSRIFLIDINNAEAVSRIEKIRQEMAEGNKVIAEGLKAGREKFEAGDLAGARELFLQVLAGDADDATAKFYIDKIEEGLARSAGAAGASGRFAAPAGGLDFEKATPISAAAQATPVPKLAAAARPMRGFAVNRRVAAIAAVVVVVIAIG